MNRVNKLGVCKHRPLTISSHISRPSSQINAILSHVLKSSILFLLKMAPWHWNLNDCSSNSLPNESEVLYNGYALVFFQFALTDWMQCNRPQASNALHLNLCRIHWWAFGCRPNGPRSASPRTVYARTMIVQKMWMICIEKYLNWPFSVKCSLLQSLFTFTPTEWLAGRLTECDVRSLSVRSSRTEKNKRMIYLIIICRRYIDTYSATL